jgi:hypothetical protein
MKKLFFAKENQRFLFIFLAWLIGTAVAFGFCIEKFNLLTDYRLVKNGVATEGTIVDKIPEKHYSIKYSYQFNGQTFESGEYYSYTGKQFNEIKLDDKLSVIFDPQNPQHSIAGVPKEVFREDLFFSFLVLLIPTIAVIVSEVKRILSEEQHPAEKVE